MTTTKGHLMNATRYLRLVIAMVALTGCAIFNDYNVPNYNAGSLEELQQNPTATTIATAAQGMIYASREDQEFYVIVLDRKSTRLNSSHLVISYAVFCLKKKKNKTQLVTYMCVTKSTTQHL